MTVPRRRVLVIGANRPAALECVRQCVAAGDEVWATCERPSRVPALADLATEHATLRVVSLDPTAPDTVRAMLLRLGAEAGALDLVIHGGIDAQPLAAHGEPPRDARLDTLQPAGLAPRVLVLSSWLGSITGKTQGGDYALCAALAGLHMLLRAFAHDVQPRGITVLVGNPGPLKTEIEGPAFKVPVDRSVSGLLAAIAAADIDQSGTFVDWNGQLRAW
jgi:NAD(P)-dependent dehydrogenase (short-subunit alcohol dehydrogenase family)